MPRINRLVKEKDKSKEPPDGSFLMVDKRLLQKYGPDIAVFLSNLIDKWKYFTERNMLENGMFFLTYEEQTAQTKLSKFQLTQCKNKLFADGIIRTEFRHHPRKEYYAINTDALGELHWLKNLTIIGKEIKPLLVKKLNQSIRKPKKENKEGNLNIPDGENNNINISFLPNEQIQLAQFDKWKGMYPRERRGSFSKALAAWNALCMKSDRPTWRTMSNSLSDYKRSNLWTTLNGKWIPTIENYILDECWEIPNPQDLKAYSKDDVPVMESLIIGGYTYKLQADGSYKDNHGRYATDQDVESALADHRRKHKLSGSNKNQSGTKWRSGAASAKETYLKFDSTILADGRKVDAKDIICPEGYRCAMEKDEHAACDNCRLFVK